MKARIPKTDSNNMVFFGKGKEYSTVAREAEQNYYNWLSSSGINEAYFLQLIDREDFYLSCSRNSDNAAVYFCNSEGDFVMPLVWNKENGIKFSSYEIDVKLLLLLVSSKCNNTISKEKITKFTKSELFVN